MNVLTADFAAIEQAHASVFVSERGVCELFTYPRGQFVTAERLPEMAKPSEYQIFDAQAQTDCDRLLHASEANGRRLTYAWVEYDEDGHIAGGTFALEPTSEYQEYYVYEPGHGIAARTQYDSSCSEPVNLDWYETWGC